MPNINIKVAKKIATNTTPGEVIVCGNGDYTITFDLDSEWAAETVKTARFVYAQAGVLRYREVTFTGLTVAVPVLTDVQEVYVGIYTDNVRTTTPARILCDRSILCGGGVHTDPPEDVYLQILKMLNDGITVALETNFANSVEECADTSKLYVMPDGYIYAYMLTKGEPPEITYEYADGGYWNKTDTWTTDSAWYAARTNIVPVTEGDQIKYIGYGMYNVPSVIWYDANKNILSIENDSASSEAKAVVKTAPAGAYYARFCTFGSSKPLPFEVTWILCQGVVKGYQWQSTGHLFSAGDYEARVSALERKLGAGNCLYGKKYVACGDSFTAGDFTGATDAEKAAAWDTMLQMYKTYPWWIADRNGMTLVNEAIGGSTMHNNGSANAFSVSRYKDIPTDADYVTICFGLNETSATIGTLEDTTNATVMGAWNIVLEYLITNMPYAKIGIIIPDAWCTQAMRDALVSVATYWGIPYLDLKGDPSVPLLTGGRYSNITLSTKAKALRNAAFQVSADNAHPNLKGHEYRATIIENFMRSL